MKLRLKRISPICGRFTELGRIVHDCTNLSERESLDLAKEVIYATDESSMADTTITLNEGADFDEVRDACISCGVHAVVVEE
jgi:hypothetical protein